MHACLLLWSSIFQSQRQYISTHLDESSVHHIHLQVDCWKLLKEKVDRNTTALEQVKDRVAATETRIISVTELQDSLKQRLDAAVNMRVEPGGGVSSTDIISELMAQVIQIKKQIDEYSRMDNMEHHFKNYKLHMHMCWTCKGYLLLG